MEWVEVTARSVEEAKEAALDQLHIDESDAEFEVLEEPRPGLFGRRRGEARVRARVRPTVPRPKVERRDRRRRPSEGNGDQAAAEAPGAATERAAADTAGGPPAPRPGRRRSGRGKAGAAAPRTPAPSGAAAPATSQTETPGGSPMADPVTTDEQAEIIADFLDGLLDAFDLDGDSRTEKVDDETVEVAIDGDGLGLLIGPRGNTLQSVQELARTVLLRRAPGEHQGRVRIDIGGYRQRRREALERFTRQIAGEVVTSGVAKALEPMHPADRKVVHDTVNEIDGVTTTSEGEEPRRRVVIRPA